MKYRRQADHRLAPSLKRKGTLKYPCFIPDATRAVVRGVDSADLESAGVQAVMVSAFHIAQRPGVSVVHSAGQLHSFMGWTRTLWTDSGGFQMYSLIRENPINGQVQDKGFLYRQPNGGKNLYTPIKAITNQWRLGADVMFCLDQCTHPGDSVSIQKESVDRTISWAYACKAEFLRRMDDVQSDEDRPLLFAVVQGGQDPDLRRRCSDTLLEIGFDGFGFGGWPIDDDGQLVDMVGYLAELIPAEFPLHGLGIGKPENVVTAYRCGYMTFDAALPTRDARRRRLLVSTTQMGSPPNGKDFYRYLHIDDQRFHRDSRPVEEGCPCLCCRRYGRSYLHHLFKIGDHTAERLATIHNLTFMNRLMDSLSKDTMRGI